MATTAGAPPHPHVYEFQDVSDESTKKHLVSAVQWASELLKSLVNADGDESMRPGTLNACEGLAFVRATKGGMGLTVAGGSGFIIRKLDQDRFGNSRWSAPVFFTVSQLGLGLALGYETVESCLALMSAHTVLRFTEDHSAVGTDLGLMTTQGAVSGVPAGTFGRSSHMDVQADSANVVFAYSLSHGLLANVSINGTQTHPHRELNHRLYGEVPLADVLAGGTRTFAELLPLYRTIADIAKKALE